MNMAVNISVDSIIEGFWTPPSPKRPGKTDYDSIKETHQLPITNISLIEISIVGVYNGHLGILIMPENY